ncbi:hypothetical protein QLQ15_17635 [Lysobacter sp. LF1]|uniref:Glycine-rich domain-containing protein n=1 Tax=Lysobacter stagni TaxID=3045172 RepID=A0ABT6XL09_9GAMM|nr:hypothetical protein [Lysobacter sp. LF1]MDI9240728.1 hypothetical protein [Lysobacter sp. LF1]
MDDNFDHLDKVKLEDRHLEGLREAVDAAGGTIGDQAESLASIEETLAGKQSRSERGVAGGYAPLANDRRVPLEFLPEGVINSNDKGWFATPADLMEAHPLGINGYWAIVGTTDSVWVWDGNSLAWVDTQQRSPVSSVNGHTGKVVLEAADVGAARPSTVEVFLQSATYFKPAGAKGIEVLLIGSGSGGNSGRTGTGSLPGGGAGGGAAITHAELLAPEVADSCAVVVAAASTGGFAAPGQAYHLQGAAGKASAFHFNGSARIVANGGDSTVDANGGPAGAGVLAGGAGGSGAAGAAGAAGAKGSGGAPGGGAGGGVSATDVAYSGGLSPYPPQYTDRMTTYVTGSNGIAPGGDAIDMSTHPVFSLYLRPGLAGAGGAGAADTDGGDGGSAGGFGAGGGGGGSTRAGYTPGKGGAGAPGVVVVITHF